MTEIRCCLESGDCVVVPPEQCQPPFGTAAKEAACPPPDFKCIPPGDDVFPTRCGQTQHSFAKNPIPSDFFGLGCSPFDGIVKLQGADTPGGDTRLRRLQAAAPAVGGQGRAIPIAMVQLSLRSCFPIKVNCPGGSTR